MGDGQGLDLPVGQTPGTLGRDFWLYFTGQLTSQIGSSFTLFALPLLVFTLTHSATNLAFTTAANLLPYLLFGLVLGAVVDRFNRKRLMMAVDAARAAVIAILPCLYLAGSLRVEHIYAVAFVQSTLGILFDCGQFAAIPGLVGRGNLITANARIMATNSAGQVVGPILAGVLVTVLPVAELLFLDAASFLLSALTLTVIRRSFDPDPPPDGQRQRAGLLDDARAGLRYVWSHPVLRTIALMMALLNFVGATRTSQLVLFAKQTLSASDAQVAWLFAAGAAGVVVVSLLAAPIRRRLSFAVTALGALVVSGLTVTIMALVAWYPAALVLWAASCGFGLLVNINTAALRQAIVPSHLYGRVISVAGVLSWSAIPFGALAGAAAIKATGDIAAVYAVIGLLTAGIAVAFSRSPVRHGDRLSDTPAPPVSTESTASVATGDSARQERPATAPGNSDR
jgi:hypothetical protein